VSEWDVVFPSQRGHLRDKSNTNADMREAIDPLGFGWVTSHTFRKTAATLLNDGGLTVREVADQLGHSRVSLTQHVYFGRRGWLAKGCRRAEPHRRGPGRKAMGKSWSGPRWRVQTIRALTALLLVRA
jgi:integrase